MTAEVRSKAGPSYILILVLLLIAVLGFLAWPVIMLLFVFVSQLTLSAFGVQGYAQPPIVEQSIELTSSGNRTLRPFETPLIPTGTALSNAEAVLLRQGFTSTSASPFILRGSQSVPADARYFEARWGSLPCVYTATVELGLSEARSVISLRGSASEAGCL